MKFKTKRMVCMRMCVYVKFKISLWYAHACVCEVCRLSLLIFSFGMNDLIYNKEVTSDLPLEQ